jgi:hypothetical protein
MNAIGEIIALAGGSVALFAGTWLLWAAIRAIRVQHALRREGSPSFIGGVRYHTTGGLVSGISSNATWPYARLDIADDRVTVSLNDDLRFLTRLIFPRQPQRMTLTTADVRRVEPDFGMPLSRGLRFRTVDVSDERDGLVFWFMPRDREEILRLVAAAGFRVSQN